MDTVLFITQRMTGEIILDLQAHIGKEVFCSYLETHNLTPVLVKETKAILHQKGTMAWNGIGSPRFWCSPEIWVVEKREEDSRWNILEKVSLSRVLPRGKAIEAAKTKHGF